MAEFLLLSQDQGEGLYALVGGTARTRPVLRGLGHQRKGSDKNAKCKGVRWGHSYDDRVQRVLGHGNQAESN